MRQLLQAMSLLTLLHSPMRSHTPAPLSCSCTPGPFSWIAHLHLRALSSAQHLCMASIKPPRRALLPTRATVMMLIPQAKLIRSSGSLSTIQNTW